VAVGLLIVTHDRLGEALLHTARSMLGLCPLQTACMSVSQKSDPETLVAEASMLCRGLDQGDGVLILTDMYGSTPSNIANEIAGHGQVQVVAGVNLPMLVRVLNYAGLSLPELVAKALSGGHDGILLCDKDLLGE
jgi:PTS system ascorbate-specific IIA component